MLSEKLEALVNTHINKEMYSSYLYLSMSAYYASKGLNGFATWMKVQAHEEMTHALKFFDYLQERGASVELMEIAKPPQVWSSPLEVFEETYAHECDVTRGINLLVDAAISDKDHATVNFLQWFVAEQVEEESTVKDIVDQLTFLQDSPQGLFMLNKELGQRVVVPATENQ